MEETTSLGSFRGGPSAAKSDANQFGDAVDVEQRSAGGGHGSLRLLAWRRRDVADLNRVARAQWQATGRLHGPEIEAGGRRWAAGDLVVLTAPDHQHGLVTSERAVVEHVEAASQLLLLRAADGRLVPVDPAEGVDHAYATTVHRAQGATIDTAHVVADGGGRELAYVAMSRARHRTDVHCIADDLEQAVEQLASDWTTDRRQRWILDHASPERRIVAPEPQGPQPSPNASTRLRDAATRPTAASASVDEPLRRSCAARNNTSGHPFAWLIRGPA